MVVPGITEIQDTNTFFIVYEFSKLFQSYTSFGYNALQINVTIPYLHLYGGILCKCKYYFAYFPFYYLFSVSSSKPLTVCLVGPVSENIQH